ncbi:MAG TPA: SCO family protein [Myxococcota bacterium]|nr:SCO family protein [Myxococcota bacterium]
MRNEAASATTAVLAIAVLAWATSGFQVVTAEAARRRAIAAAPRRVPPLQLEDAAGASFEFESLRGRRVAVAFVYTRCPQVCVRLTSDFDALAARLRARRAADGAALLSVSFDREHDTPARLRAFASLHDADGTLWRFARARDPAALARWLERFGVVVIPDGRGGFQHNAALHLVDEDGRLARIVDLGALDEAERFLVEGPS